MIKIQGLIQAQKTDYCSNNLIKKFAPYQYKYTLDFNDYSEKNLKNFLKYFLSILGVKKFREYFKNNTPNIFLENIAKHIANESTPLLNPNYVAISTYFDKPTKASLLFNQIGKALISNISRNGTTVTISSVLNPGIGTTIKTTILTVINQSNFYVNSGSFQNGDRIRISGQERKILTAVGSLITVSEPFSIILSNGLTVEQMISQLHLVNDTQLTYNTGTAISIAPYYETKTSTQALDFIHTIKVL